MHLLSICLLPCLLIDSVLLAVSALMKCFCKTLEKRNSYMLLTLALPYPI